MRTGVTRVGLGDNPRPRELLRQRSHDRLSGRSAKGAAALSNREQPSGRLDRDPWRVSVLFLWPCELFRIELRRCEVRRIPLPRTPVNKGIKRKGRSPVPWEVWGLQPKCPVGTEGGKPRADYCLPNLTPWSLSVVSIRCSDFKARF